MTYCFNPIIGEASPKAILKKILHFIVMPAFSILFSCSSPPKDLLPRTTKQVIKQAQNQHFSLRRYQTSTFLLTTYEHLPDAPAATIHIYIEGDGHSWKTRYQLSDNPTPRQPLALKLALQDPHSHVVYLARPCQYTPLKEDTHCNPQYWSSHRYAKEVIQSTQEVLDQIKAKTKNSNFLIVGFSGGASIAALVAANRKDVIKLITVAGDLNHEALNRYHHTTPMRGSLNPTDIAPFIKNIPQEHWSGSKDPIVPSWVAQNFVNTVNNPDQAKAYILSNATHHHGWVENWKEILQNTKISSS